MARPNKENERPVFVSPPLCEALMLRYRARRYGISILNDFDRERLFDLLGGRQEEEFRANYEQSIQEAIQRRELDREGRWTESLAVGREAFARQVGQWIENRMKCRDPGGQ